MRVYIIGNDGITLCREPPAAVSVGEIVVASSEELHAARLSGKRLLRCGTLCPMSSSARKSATVTRWSISCGRQLKSCRSRNPTRSARRSRTR